MMSIKHAIHWLYPHTILLGHEGKMAVEDVLKVSACFTSFPSSTFPPLPSPSFPFFCFKNNESNDQQAVCPLALQRKDEHYACSTVF